MTGVEEGQVETYERTFTTEEVREFADLSNDEGYHHLVADEDGTVVVHGLLTATMPTKVGGEIDFLARTMTFEFPRPTYTGDPVTCEVTIEEVTEGDDRTEVRCSFVCEQYGEVVMTGGSEGVVMG